MRDLALIDGTTGEILTRGARECGRTYLKLDDGLTFDQWQSIGGALSQYERGIQWWIGDWWAHGDAAYGERAAAAAKDTFGRAFQTLMNAGTVSRRFETSRRREALSWSHHAEVSALPPDTAETLLDQAEERGWSRRELRAEVHRAKSGAKVVAARQPTCTLASLQDAIARSLKFGCIYADPPWRYDNQSTRAATSDHYRESDDNDAAGMTVDQICALPIGDLAADDAHLHMWTTNAFLFEAPRIFAAWGFEFRSSFVWVKRQIGIGNYWRNSHEFLLTAIRGDAKRFNDRSLKSWLECDRGQHSVKPEQVRAMLEKASHGPYLELFGRRVADGWAVWGNEIEDSLFSAALEKTA